MMRIQRAKLEKVNISASEQTNFKYFLPLIASSMCSQIIVMLLRINRRLRNVAKRRTMLRLKRTVLMLLVLRHKIVAPPRELNSKLSKIRNLRHTIDSFADEEIPVYFRFRSKEQLHRLITGFQIPAIVRIIETGNVFHGEEFLLIGLYRLHLPTTISDGSFKTIFGLGHTAVSMVFNAFIEFLVNNWGYLLFDNLQFWLPYLPDCAQAVRDKCNEKGCYFPPGGLRVAGFIDNTMNATCRPGGGPARDGQNAPRNDPLIQRAWYNGWKKMHGMKYQTVDLPNGMNMHVWGPISIRHNDLTSLRDSHINDLLVDLQHDREYQWVIYGDSAYVHVPDSHILARHHNDNNTERQTLENRALSACRECIEWDYGDVGKMWAMVDYKKKLKIQQMQVKKIYVSAMILRNAFVTMNAGITSEYFNIVPPTFEVWTNEGPRVYEI